MIVPPCIRHTPHRSSARLCCVMSDFFLAFAGKIGSSCSRCISARRRDWSSFCSEIITTRSLFTETRDRQVPYHTWQAFFFFVCVLSDHCYIYIFFFSPVTRGHCLHRGQSLPNTFDRKVCVFVWWSRGVWLSTAGRMFWSYLTILSPTPGLQTVFFFPPSDIPVYEVYIYLCFFSATTGPWLAREIQYPMRLV